MFLCPLKDKSQGASAKRSIQEVQGANIDQRFVISVQRMEMGRRMIFLKHLDENTIEGAYGWHHLALSELAYSIMTG